LRAAVKEARHVGSFVFSPGPSTGISKAAWKLQADVLKPHGGYKWLIKSLVWNIHRFIGGFRKAIRSPMRLSNSCCKLQKKGVGKSVKILKHFGKK
jgi:hypothetical protein